MAHLGIYRLNTRLAGQSLFCC